MAQSQKIPPRAKLLILVAVLASLLEIIDSSIVNVAIPTMMGNLGATLDEISWVITGYIIANAIVLPIAGWMSEQLGRKFYYTGCIVLFTASSVACGLAPNLHVLVLFRLIQGFSGGALLPTSQALIYEAFPKEQAGMASAIFGMSVMIGPTVGPTLGGYLTDNLGWRSIFNINLPIGVVVAILSYLLVEDVGFDPEKPKAEQRQARKERPRTPVDVMGLALLVMGIGALQYVLERGNADDWFSSTTICICAALAVVGLGGLIWWELRTAHPILQLKHFHIPSFRSGVMLMAALGGMLYGLMFLIPVFVSNIQGFTATQTGELFIPGALASAAMMPFIGAQLRRRDPRLLIGVGVITLAWAGLWISRFDALTSVEGMFWPLLLRGAAMAYLFVPINTAVLTQFQGVAIGEAAGMLNLCRQLGGSIGIAVLSTVFQRSQTRNYSVLASYVSSLRPQAAMTNHALMGMMHMKLPSTVGMGSASLQALKLFFFRVQKQAFVLSFQKVMVIAVIAFVLMAVIPLISLRSSKITGPIPDAH